MMTAIDVQLIRRWCALIAAWNVEGMRDACWQNDPNGDFGESTGDEMVEILVEWMKDVCS